MMQHYLQTKEAYPDCILFYRLGDFYEMFFEDAETVSKELELTLTGKACGLAERAPMCGVPFHAADTYISRLVEKGYRVAVCEQVEDPRLAKGMVKREVTRIVTPGTNIDMSSLKEGQNNYIFCIAYGPGISGIAVCDVSTGEF
ncbi:MAG: DNA mismatch repair protein MutS, partial [Lachnospiraceae bacterium]|nr:DNA mismatch repair protein MutS [Lachnospiraceae bacterium]